MLPFDQWPNPDDVCQGEYSLIYEFCNDLFQDVTDDEVDEVIKGSLNEFIKWATFLLNMTKEDLPPEE
jgi:hypothetical protein